MKKQTEKPQFSRYLLLIVLMTLACVFNADANHAVLQASVIKQQMLNQVVPASNALFAVANQPPTDQKTWAALNTQVRVLSASATWLRARKVKDKQEQWRLLTTDFQLATSAALKAVSSKKPEAVSDAGDAVYAVCENCHRVFLPKVVNDKANK